ncbi:MFS transporter [Marisediminicola senii]|uniref:MFS transporter n=1 Tax=Marisediminicola senii TaxID=2711233 RepID=UPI0013ECFAE6|nr:MFS transporter [Marisediminicola senii]
MERRQRLVLAIAVLASFVAFLDGSVINVALPAITDELGGGLALQQWVVDAYLITLGSLILLAGSLSDVFGRIVVLRFGLVGFGIASVLCAIAPTGEFLIVSRALQGIAGALLVPSSLAIILSNFRDAAQAKAIGQWTAWTGGAFIAGPLLGGIFVDLLSWRLVFAINIVPIVITLWLLSRLGQRDERQVGVRVDYLGAVLGVVGLGAPVFALIEQGNLGWRDPLIWGTMLVGVLAFVAFIVRQRLATNPIMPLGLFSIRNFSVGNVATVAFYAALSLGGFVVTVYLQQSAGYTATAAGAAFLPVTLLSIALSSFFGGLAGRYGPRLFMAVGPVLAGIGYLLMLGIDTDAAYLTDVLPGVLVFGLGLSVTVAPLTAAILGSISVSQAGIGSAVNNAISRIAGLVAIALIGVIVGPSLDGMGFERGVLVTAALFFAAAIVSAVGIRNPSTARAAKPVPVPATTMPLPRQQSQC